MNSVGSGVSFPPSVVEFKESIDIVSKVRRVARRPDRGVQYTNLNHGQAFVNG